jgi:GTP-binding protein Era
MENGFVSGFAAIIGRPNVGKSTLLNRFLGRKLAIVSDKPQTTRNRIVGVYHGPEAQVVFLDTPGVHKPRHRLGEYMVSVAKDAWSEVDCILFVVDAAAGIGGGDQFIAEQIREVGTPIILAVNKCDLLKPHQVMETLAKAPELGDFHEIFPISAETGYNVPELLSAIINLMPQGPRYFPEGMLTDRPEEFVIAELIREQVLHHTREEVPHSVAVVIESFEEGMTEGVVYIRARIHVERKSHRGIILGQKGSRIKEIGTAARKEIEALLSSRVYLDLYVSTSEGWRNNPTFLQRLGYH